MLTLDETVAAIKALNTPEDIIGQACFRVLMKNKRGEASNPTIIARELITDMSQRFESAEVLEGLIVGLGSFAAHVCRAGDEAEMMTKVTSLLQDTFTKFTVRRLLELRSIDPKEATEQLLKLFLGVMGSDGKG